jgi:hypothetical protein
MSRRDALVLRRSPIPAAVLLAAVWLVWVWPLGPRWTVTLSDFAASPLDHRRIVGFSADNATLFTDCFPPQADCYRLQRWSVADGKDLGEIACTLRPAISRRFQTALASDGRFLAIAGLEEGMPDRPHVWLVDIPTGAMLGAFPAGEAVNAGHRNTLIAFSPDSSWLLLLDEQQPANAAADVVRLVSTADPTAVRAIPLSGRLDGLSVSPDGRTLAADLLDTTFDVKHQKGPRRCELIDVETGHVRLRLEGERHAAFLPDGHLVLSDGRSGERLRRLAVSAEGVAPSGREFRLSNTFPQGPTSWGGLHLYEASPAATGVIVRRSGFRGPQLFYRIDWDTGACTTRGEAAVHSFLEEASARELSMIFRLAPDGSLAASLDDHGRVRVWDIATPRWQRWPGIATVALFAAAVAQVLAWWRTLWRKGQAITDNGFHSRSAWPGPS